MPYRPACLPRVGYAPTAAQRSNTLSLQSRRAYLLKISWSIKRPNLDAQAGQASRLRFCVRRFQPHVELFFPRQQHGHSLVIDSRHEFVGTSCEERKDLDIDLRSVFLDRALVAAPDAREGEHWALVSPLQCKPVPRSRFQISVWFAKRRGRRRSSNEPRQNLLSRILSSRTLVTRRGASQMCATTAWHGS